MINGYEVANEVVAMFGADEGDILGALEGEGLGLDLSCVDVLLDEV